MPDKDKEREERAAEREERERGGEQRAREQGGQQQPTSGTSSTSGLTNTQPSPGTTPTDAPVPPGPQGGMQGTVTNAPASRPSGAAGEAAGEEAGTYLPDGTPMDNTRVITADYDDPVSGQKRRVTAAATPPDQATGAAGQSLGPTGEMGGGFIAETLAPRPAQSTQAQAQTRLERAAASQVVQKVGHLVQRPLLDWGLVGQGDVVAGHMILIDLESGEKVRVLPNTRIEDDRILANSRNLPEFLINGDGLQRIMGGGGGSSKALPRGER
jgi:hypothetical protein